MITEEELNEVMVDPKSLAVLESIGVDVVFLQTLQVMTYEDPDARVPIYDILDQMLLCRRQMPATMKHVIVQQRLSIWMIVNKILHHEHRMDIKLDVRFEKLLEEIGRLAKRGRDSALATNVCISTSRQSSLLTSQTSCELIL